ncbi:phosphoribosylanthranilate isomerase [Aquimarina algicola]|uniref:N-(5'-phosphoribosyl)anthranilate isomerase n=2 Tax=Aquimarina algicola TaxID=2589995 RepID=A0A504JDH2_9FLAO|nr:phosphoribosylanthranilate isomerase [Aquimarina algicola]TPN84620.1 phosphoribosylanthranilate isomerase [Aquimarina algicola]
MKSPENIREVAMLQPNYLGFIFYENSPRNVEEFIDTSIIPTAIKKVGVFVNATIDFIIKKAEQFKLQAIQLHGNETAEYCLELKSTLQKIFKKEDQVNIWKVFSIKDQFDFEIVKPYENIVDYFLFDTKGPAKGGNGYTFDWNVLKNYPSTTPFILSGGIGLDEINAIQSLLDSPESKYLHAIDINSKFEIQPGLKNTETLQKFLSGIENL